MFQLYLAPSSTPNLDLSVCANKHKRGIIRNKHRFMINVRVVSYAPIEPYGLTRPFHRGSPSTS